MNLSEKILIFTDGACSGNPGPGGFGVVIVRGQNVLEIGDGEFNTTNNRMEMSAAIAGLQAVSDSRSKIWILTDSTYVINGATKWIFGWKKRSWKNSKNESVLNKDLWVILDNLCEQFKGRLEWKYVRGHAGIPGNERCDEIAVNYSKNLSSELYKGPISKYSVDILKFPSDLSLPQKKTGKKTVTKKAYSYVSKVNGVISTSKTWPECERKVKGRSGVKFKKVYSKEEEALLIKAWR